MSRSPRKLSPALDTPLLGRGPSPSTASQLLSPMARAATWSVVASRGQWRSRAAPTIAWTTSRLTLRARGPGRCRRRRSAPGRCQAGRAARQGSGSRRRQVPLRRARTCPETPPRTTCTTHGQPASGWGPARRNRPKHGQVVLSWPPRRVCVIRAHGERAHAEGHRRCGARAPMGNAFFARAKQPTKSRGEMWLFGASGPQTVLGRNEKPTVQSSSFQSL